MVSVEAADSNRPQLASAYLRLLNEAAGRLLAATDAELATAELFALIRGELRLDVYVSYTAEPDGRLRLGAVAGVDDPRRDEAAYLELGAAAYEGAASRREPRYAAGIHCSEDSRAVLLRRLGLTCYACTSMLVGPRLLGGLGFGRRHGEKFSEDELQFLRTVTQYLAMASERLRVEAALRESERRLNAVLDNASVAIFLMDARQHCTYMNATAEKLTGYSLEETFGQPLHDVVHHMRPDGSPYPLHECPIDRAYLENNQEQGEEIFVHRDGRFYPVAFTASPIRDEESKTVGTIIEVRDISEQKRNEQARELLMREVDHRARNALAVIQSIVQLTKAPNTAAYKEIVLNRICALGRAQGSLAAQRWEGAPVRQVIERELEAIAKPGQFKLVGPHHMLRPEQVQPLGMIFHELATNAAKHGALTTVPGRVTVRWRFSPRGGLDIDWEEIGGPEVQRPSRQGFGSRLMEGLAKQLNTAIEREWRREGLVASIRRLS